MPLAIVSLSRRLLARALPLVLLAAAAPLSAQETPADTARRDTVPSVPADTARPDTVRGDTARRGITPRGAFLRSIVLPGWGQSELGAPERGLIYFALEAGSLWMVYKSGQKLEEAERQQRYLIESGQLEEGRLSPLVRDRRNQREDWITLSVFWLFFSGADAFVAAYLRDFDAHVGVIPDSGGAVRLQATVPLGGRQQ